MASPEVVPLAQTDAGSIKMKSSGSSRRCQVAERDGGVCAWSSRLALQRGGCDQTASTHSARAAFAGLLSNVAIAAPRRRASSKYTASCTVRS